VDERDKRDGGYIERVGYYDPRKSTKDWLKLDSERIKHWIGVGAQPTDTVRKLIKQANI
jgi:small subunit ribosomal protein S16